MNKGIKGWLAAMAALSLLAACGKVPAPSSVVSQEQPFSQSQSMDAAKGEFPPAVTPEEELSSSTASSGTESVPVPAEKEEPEVIMSADSVKAGSSLFLLVKNAPEGVTPTAQTNMNYTPVFFPYGDGWAAAVAVRMVTQPGNYAITVAVGEETKNLSLQVTDGGFEVETFEVDQSVADSTVNNRNANAEFNRVTEPLKKQADGQKYWSGKFSLPLNQDSPRITSSYGYTRVVNGSASRHGGVDFAAPAGTPVLAPNAGRVLYAGYLQLTGNTVVVEHGFGLQSWYYHMESTTCKTGDMVSIGDELGKVGSTGFSTGPHLHFAMTVGGVFTNPWEYIENNMLS